MLVLAVVACRTSAKQPPVSPVPDASAIQPDAPSFTCGGDPCNVLTQQGCCVGHKCTWMLDVASPPLGHIDCPPDGNVPAGSACTVGSAGITGFDDCVHGSVCFNATCELICDPRGGNPTCPAGLACRIHPGFLGPTGLEAAGVCE